MKKSLFALAAATALALPATPVLAADFGGTVSSGLVASQQIAPADQTLGYDRDKRRYRESRRDYRDDRRYDRRYDRRDDRRDYREDRRDYRDDYRDVRRHDVRYDRNGRYVEPRRVNRGDHVWRGRDGQYYCQRENGTTGLIIGAAGGALLGRTIDTRGDRTIGTLLGAALGGVLGREIDRGGARCR